MGCNTSPLALGRKDAPGYLTLQGWSWSAGALLASGGSALPRTPVPRSWPGGDQPHGSSKNPPRPGFCPHSAVSSSGVGPCGRAGPVSAGRAQAARASPAAGSHRLALCGHSGRPQHPSPGAHSALELGTAEGGGQGGPERAGSRTPTSCPEATRGPRSGGPSGGPGAAGSTSPAGCPPAGAGPAPPPPRAAAQWRPAGRRVLPGRLGAPPSRAGASVSAGVT